ncbi:MAG: hypothetical protein M3454_18470 [Actinomycetota bacterium]|nr:hypothetical protein [Actinomycetota bacterium]
MADAHIDRWLSSLNATFEAAVEREEEQAAGDLAFSLLQDLSQVETLRRGKAAVLKLAGGASVPIARVGRDYVAAGNPPNLIVPLTFAVILVSPSGPAPEIADDTLLLLLRRAARLGTYARISTTEGEWQGRIVKAGVDHLIVNASGQSLVVGNGSMRTITLLRAS